MTPEQLTEIEARNENCVKYGDYHDEEKTALCAALRQAWADRDSLRPHITPGVVAGWVSNGNELVTAERVYGMLTALKAENTRLLTLAREVIEPLIQGEQPGKAAFEELHARALGRPWTEADY